MQLMQACSRGYAPPLCRVCAAPGAAPENMLNNMFNEAGSLPCQAGPRGPGWDESRTPGMRKGRKGAASVSKGDGRRAAGSGR